VPLAFLGLVMVSPALREPLSASAAASSVSMIQNSSCGTPSGFCFNPASIIVTPGSTVAWTNMTTVAHTATSNTAASWDTGSVSGGQTSSPVTFATQGSFPYHCAIHPDMHGTIVVVGASGAPGQYHSLTPSRLMDTRDGGQPLTAGVPIVLQVTGGQVPSTATAVVLNVTVTNTIGSGFLTVWPTGNPQPTASNLNWAARETRPNLVTVAVGLSGLVSIVASSRTDVVADLEGFFAPPNGSAGGYVPVPPSRLLDTRIASAPLTGGATVDLQITGAGGVVPTSGVSGVVLNVTVTNTSAAGFLTVYPTGAVRPTASNLNWVAGWTVPNRVFVLLGTAGKVTFFNFAGVTDLVVDVTGYFTDGTATGNLFTPASPVRVLDTRVSAQTLGPGGTLVVPVAPSSATAAVLNVTATNASAASFLTVYPGSSRPTASDLNFVASQTIPNLVVATLSSSGLVTIYNNTGSTDVVVDLVGWFG